jgi:hypothetical protein
MLSNHLGNLLATISDKKIAVMSDAESFIPYFVSNYSLPIHKPETLISKFQSPNSSTAPMTERTAVVTPTDVRYGFQGQEEDDELWSGAVSFKYRVEEARLGRFFSVDPKHKEYSAGLGYTGVAMETTVYLAPIGAPLSFGNFLIDSCLDIKNEDAATAAQNIAIRVAYMGTGQIIKKITPNKSDSAEEIVASGLLLLSNKISEDQAVKENTEKDK